MRMPGWLGQDYDYHDEKEDMKRPRIELSIATQFLLVSVTGLVAALVLTWPMTEALQPEWHTDGLFALLVLIIVTELSAIFT